MNRPGSEKTKRPPGNSAGELSRGTQPGNSAGELSRPRAYTTSGPSMPRVPAGSAGIQVYQLVDSKPMWSLKASSVWI
eukprot:2936513-Pyramimonas_sp.AAC.1